MHKLLSSSLCTGRDCRVGALKPAKLKILNIYKIFLLFEIRLD